MRLRGGEAELAWVGALLKGQNPKVLLQYIESVHQKRPVRS